MCGISGIFNLKHGVDIDLLLEMNNIIKHRGPDDEGFCMFDWTNNEINSHMFSGDDSASLIKESYCKLSEIEKRNNFFLGLGHRRLAILDLTEKGHQPMFSYDKKLAIVFNGEIYNYIEIRNQLKNRGHKFYSNCDTEVILESYKEWGEGCVNCFNGMWSFALYDIDNNKLFCSRDRYGIKPFYYYYDNSTFIFGSEVKQIICDKKIKRVGNRKVIFSYLCNGFTDCLEETFFKNIYSLMPSYNLVLNFDLNKCHIDKKMYKYYTIKQQISNNNEEQCINEFKNKLFESIKLRMRSDVEIGSCLSGGLDSSSIVTLANKMSNYRINSFTTKFPNNPDIDESMYSHIVASDCDCIENFVVPDYSDFINDYEKLIYYQDFPFRTLSIYSQRCVMKKANEKKIKILLDGQGADETLLGYESFIYYRLLYDIHKLKFKTFFAELKEFKKLETFSYKFLINATIKYLFPKFKYSLKKKSLLENKKFNCSFIQDNIDSYISVDDMSSPFSLAKSCSIFSLQDLLRYEDRNSMSFSIETRLPYLDYNLAEFSINVNFDYKCKNGYMKYITRMAFDGEIDDKVLWRKNKLGFNAPQKTILDNLPNSFIDKYINKEEMYDIFNKEYIVKIFKEKIDDSFRWLYLSIAIWIDIFKVEI